MVVINCMGRFEIWVSKYIGVTGSSFVFFADIFVVFDVVLILLVLWL